MFKDLRNAAGVALCKNHRRNYCHGRHYITSPRVSVFHPEEENDKILVCRENKLQLREGRRPCHFLLWLLGTEFSIFCQLLVVLRETSVDSLSFHAIESPRCKYHKKSQPWIATRVKYAKNIYLHIHKLRKIYTQETRQTDFELGNELLCLIRKGTTSFQKKYIYIETHLLYLEGEQGIQL